MQKSNKRERGKEKRIIHVKPAQSKPGWEEESSLCACHSSWLLWLPFFSNSPFLEIPVALDFLLCEKKLNNNWEGGEREIWLVGRSQERRWMERTRALISCSALKYSHAPGRAHCPALPLHPSGRQGAARQSSPGTFLGVLLCSLGCLGDVMWEQKRCPKYGLSLKGRDTRSPGQQHCSAGPCSLIPTCCRLQGDGGDTAAWTCGS